MRLAHEGALEVNVDALLGQQRKAQRRCKPLVLRFPGVAGFRKGERESERGLYSATRVDHLGHTRVQAERSFPGALDDVSAQILTGSGIDRDRPIRAGVQPLTLAFPLAFRGGEAAVGTVVRSLAVGKNQSERDELHVVHNPSWPYANTEICQCQEILDKSSFLV